MDYRLLAFGIATAFSAQGGTLTLDEAIQIAENGSFTNRAATSNVLRAEQQLRLAQSALGPNVTANAQYTRYGRQQFASFGEGTPPIAVTPLYGLTTGITLGLPLDIAGNLARQSDAQEQNLRGLQEGLLLSRLNTKYTVRTAYFEALRQQGLVDVARASVNNAQAQVDQGEAQLREGYIARIDVERLRSQLTQFQNDLLIAQNNYTQAVQTLNFQLARPIETPTTLVTPNTLPEVPDSPDRLVAEGQVDRPDVRQFERSIRSLGLIARAQEAGLNPTLNFSLGYIRNLNPAGFNAQTDTTTAIATLSIPILDSGATRARVRAARQDQEVARINLDQARLSISRNVRGAFSALSTARARLATAEAQVNFATEVERLARVRRDAGEATFLEVVDAQLQLAQARNGLVSARYDYLSAYAQLQNAVGRDDVETPLPPERLDKSPAGERERVRQLPTPEEAARDQKEQKKRGSSTQ